MGRDKILNQFINQLIDWASHKPAFKALGLVGSHANMTAKADSDIDLILLVDGPDTLVGEPSWIDQFDLVDDAEVENYGKVTSIRVWYSSGPEVEFGIADIDWAVPPVDRGTQAVIDAGLKVLFEREPLLSIHLQG